MRLNCMMIVNYKLNDREKKQDEKRRRKKNHATNEVIQIDAFEVIYMSCQRGECCNYFFFTYQSKAKRKKFNKKK